MVTIFEALTVEDYQRIKTELAGNGTLGYLQNADLLEVVNVGGLGGMSFKAIRKPASTGVYAPALAIYTRWKKGDPPLTEFWKRGYFYFPDDYSAITKDGKQGWINLCDNNMWMRSSGGPWVSGDLQFYESASREGLYFQGSYRKSPATSDGKATGYHEMTVPKGEWIEWIQYVKVHPKEGIVKHWVDGELVFQFFNICTDPRPWISVGTPRTYWRHYTHNNLNFPQTMYWAKLLLRTEPIDSEPVDLPPPSPEPQPEPEPEPEEPEAPVSCFDPTWWF